MNTSDYLLANANDDEIAFITKDAEITYALFKSICAKLVNELDDRKIKPGDRVAILGKNSPFWAAAYLAVLKIGAVAVPISTLLPPNDLAQKLAFAKCKLLFIDKSLSAKYLGHDKAFPFLLLDDAPLSTSSAQWKFSEENFDLDQDAALMFTSGTTDRPRAVRITHRNIQANTESILKYLRLDSKERMMVILPLFYCYGASLLHTHLRVGATLVLCNTFTYPETMLDMMESAQCTGFAGVPSTFQIMLRNSTFPRRALPHLGKIQQAGGKLHDALLRELVETHPNAKVYVMYGQTEATARLSFLPPELLPSKMGSIGKGIPDVALSVIKENGEPARPGETGEIVATGENISPGYLDEPEASREKFSNGALLTGDMATVDEDGYIYIVDRKSDFIKSYGHRISSYEIESCVLQVSEVVSAAAVGIPDEYAGELVKVFVILSKDAKIEPDDILQHCNRQLAKHMLPREIAIVPSFPMNAHGKVVKSELKKWGKPG